MTYVTIKKEGVGAVQQDASYSNFYALNDGLAVFQKPAGSYGTGHFQNTCHPLESNNIRWSSARCKLITEADATPGTYRTIVQLWGIINSGKEELIGEYISSTISTTEATEDVVFNLANSGGSPELTYIDDSGTTGKVHINLPFRYKYLSNVKLRSSWLDGWNYSRPIFLVGGTAGVVSQDLQIWIDVTWEANMRVDFTDVRFIHPDGKTFLCFDRYSYVSGVSAKFVVYLDTVAPSPNYTPITMHFGKSTAVTNKSAPFNVYRVYDDFEDGQYGAGRVFPYRQWWNLLGTTAMASGADKITGTYSVKHTGNGSDQMGNCFYNTTGRYHPDGMRFESDFKIKTQGSLSETPYAWLCLPRYQSDALKINGIATHFDGTNQVLRFLSWYDGSMHIAAATNWLTGKVPAGTVYHLTVIDTGANMKVYINNTLYINANYTNQIRVGHVGMGGNKDTSIIFDNIRIMRQSAAQPAVGVPSTTQLLSAQSNISPDGTPSQEATSLTFTRPWDTKPVPGFVYGLERGSSEGYVSNLVQLKNKGRYQLGYDGIDKYQALRFKTEVIGDVNCNVTLSDFVYEYEVLR